MKLLNSFMVAIGLMFSMTAQAITYDELKWIMQDQDLGKVLSEQRLLKSFEQTQLCRAAFCYDYVMCSALRDYELDKTAYFVTKISGHSIFFRKKLVFQSEKFEQLPDICKE